MSIVKSFSVGNGDMFYIKHNSDNFSVIDCSINDDNLKEIIDEIKSESKTKGFVDLFLLIQMKIIFMASKY